MQQGNARIRARVAGCLALVCLLLGTSGCLDFIKRRLPPPQPNSDGCVVFVFEAPSARVVQLMGSWPENNWGEGLAQTGSYLVGSMEKNPQTGVWERTECLAPGRYEYKFRIDELNWKDDPNNPQRVDDSYGGFNSLLIVE